MELTEEQKQHVARWITEGLKLSDVQRRLGEEFNVRLTYMETRFLIDDLKLTPQDVVEASPAPAAAASEAAAARGLADEVLPSDPFDSPAAGPGKVSLKVDEIMRPGAIVSGSVTFSDGGRAKWYLDQMGRLGMDPDKPGYHPPQADIAEFQILLEKELVKLGM